jgi:hypothetical protein
VFSPATPAVGDNVTFDGTDVLDSFPGTGSWVFGQNTVWPNSNWYWYFGDGSSAGQAFNSSNAWRTHGSPIVSHVYSNPGNYTVVLNLYAEGNYPLLPFGFRQVILFVEVHANDKQEEHLIGLGRYAEKAGEVRAQNSWEFGRDATGYWVGAGYLILVPQSFAQLGRSAKGFENRAGKKSYPIMHSSSNRRNADYE